MSATLKNDNSDNLSLDIDSVEHKTSHSLPMLLGRVTSIIAVVSGLVVFFGLLILAIRASVRLGIRWDTFMYHIPFSALRGGLDIPYVMNDRMWQFYLGFPPLPHLIQGVLWRITGSINATGIVNYLAFMIFLSYTHFFLKARFWLVATIALSAPMVIIHAASSYVDLFGNSFLAIGLSSCLYVFLNPNEKIKLATWGGLLGLIAAAWSKYQLVPIVALSLCLFMLVVLSAKTERSEKKQLIISIFIATLLAASPYLKNLYIFGNPFWPVRMPILTDLFPYNYTVNADYSQVPPPLKGYSQPHLFVHSLFEIDHPTSYPDRPRWNIDQGGFWIAFRMGGFWATGVALYLLTSICMLFACYGRRGVLASIGLIGLICFVSVLPQSHELRYYLFIPLVWSAIIGILFGKFQKKYPWSAVTILVISLISFCYMAHENQVHYQIEKVDYAKATKLWGADSMWPKLKHGVTYCAVDIMPIGILLTGPTMHEYSIVERAEESQCPEGSSILRR